ncbi:uncharacterized protein [Malus domestica]|uniref:uncharacterized protein n=1 Tax=Malus domestica TaxID=3750 RepID=UPI0010AA2EEE|nr:uncharacterized protein LOC114827410 [Malus domestica]
MDSFKLASSCIRPSGADRITLARGVYRLVRWSPPPVNWRKINVNACWRRNFLCGNIGIVVRDSYSGCNVVRSVRVHAFTIEMVEALAVLEGCLLANNLQLLEVVIESDAQVIMRSLNSLSLSCDWDLFPNLIPVLEIGRSFQSCSWSWVLRATNRAADFVARNISPEMCGFSWVVRPPSSLVGILNKDGLPCPPL